MILRGGTVVTMDDRRRVVRDGEVVVREGRIAAVGPDRARAGEPVLDCRGMLLTPGLVNAHVHLTGPALFPGIEPGESPVAEHFPRYVIPAHEFAAPEDEAAAARLSAATLLRAGTSAAFEAGVCRFPDAVLEALAPTGLRAAVGTWAADLWPLPEAFATDTAGAVARIDAALALRAPGERLRTVPSVIGHTGASDELLRAAAERAAARELPWTLHMSAMPDDGEAYRARTGRDPLVHLETLGVLDSRVTVAHGIHLSEAELAAVRRTGATVAYCPGAALRLTTGVSRAGRHPELDHVALGTDTTNASNHHDLLRAADMAIGTYGEARGDRSVLTAQRTLEWCTLGGARALGLAGEIGALAEGMSADVAVWDPGQPVPHAANALVHGSPRARHLLIAGEVVLVEGEVPGWSEILAAASVAAARVAARAGLPTHTGWAVD